MPYKAHPSAGSLPADETRIWRFMSVGKFLSFLTKSSIHFCQATRLRDRDPYEGTLTQADLSFYQQIVADQAFARQVMQVPPHEHPPFNYKEALSPDAQKKFGQIFASTVYVNSWNISEHESAFLWSTYASVSDGVAIQSTVGKLRKSIEMEERAIYIGRVLYLDYSSARTPQDNKLIPIFRKRKSFEAERELRACFIQKIPAVGWSDRAITENPSGYYVNCNIDDLVETLFVNPTAPSWYLDAVSEVVRRLGITMTVKKSPLLELA